MPQTIKKIVLWEFARASWQWDVLCLLIIFFIFLTPKSWYENVKPSVPVRTLTLSAEKYSPDKAQLETAVRSLSGDPQAEILGFRKMVKEDGQIVYEVDIR
ncbi:MAG TPA: hypothetical protein VGO50_11495 [Pyrinomonadaceae bacterium]|jgi:hypothetical protein|nr:hypothetical protein [Pyrinomonadaceae bacterium]